MRHTCCSLYFPNQSNNILYVCSIILISISVKWLVSWLGRYGFGRFTGNLVTWVWGECGCYRQLSYIYALGAWRKFEVTGNLVTWVWLVNWLGRYSFGVANANMLESCLGFGGCNMGVTGNWVTSLCVHVQSIIRLGLLRVNRG